MGLLDRPVALVIAARARNRPVIRDCWDRCRPAQIGYTQHTEDGFLTIACSTKKLDMIWVNFISGPDCKCDD
jgi:hypothetical protein